MNIYEIDKSILELVNEDGEISDIEAFEALQMEREAKIENVALWLKNLTAEAIALKQEELNLACRRHIAEAKIERLKKYLAYALNGNRFETPKVALSWRKSDSVEVDEAVVPMEWCEVEQKLKPNKTAIKTALKKGIQIDGCKLVERQNLQIK